MCDRVPFLEHTIYSIESEMEQLTVLLKKCKESTKKVYKCYLISDQINNKKKEIESLKKSLQENMKWCILEKEKNNSSF